MNCVVRGSFAGQQYFRAYLGLTGRGTADFIESSVAVRHLHIDNLDACKILRPCLTQHHWGLSDAKQMM